MRTHARFRALTALTVSGLLVAGGGVAHADDISNNIDASVDAVAEVMPLNVGGDPGTTSLYVTPTGGDGKPGCNFTGFTTLALSLSSNDTAVATVRPSLRYDTTGSQYIYNWKTPTGAGTCYALTMTASDGSTLNANFKLK